MSLSRKEPWRDDVLGADGRCGVGSGGRPWSGLSVLRAACAGSGKALAREAFASFSISLRAQRGERRPERGQHKMGAATRTHTHREKSRAFASVRSLRSLMASSASSA
jgi:hypothetical protein